MLKHGITFGICYGTDYNYQYLVNLINSIYKHGMEYGNMPFEILAIGHLDDMDFGRVKFFKFDETVKAGWITKKKNILTRLAQYDTCVLTHDYYFLPDNEIFKYFNTVDFKIKKLFVPQIFTKEGLHHSDYVVHPKSMEQIFGLYPDVKQTCEITSPNENPIYVCRVSNDDVYTINNKNFYISGGLIIAKTLFLLEFPQNENLAWGEAEDLDWTYNIWKWNKAHILKPIPEVYFTVQKPNKWAPCLLPSKAIKYLQYYEPIFQ